MAKKKITNLSSPVEVRTAYEQIAKAQQEYSESLNALRNDQGIPIVPSTGQPLTDQQKLNLAENIAAKYDYVDFGVPQPTQVEGQPLQVNIGGERFFVVGLGDNTNTTNNTSVTTISPDDAYKEPVSATPVATPPGTNPKAAKTDQSTSIDTGSSTAAQSAGVERDDRAPASTTQKEAVQSEKTVATQEQQKASEAGTGVIESNPNSPLSNDRPGRLSDEFQTFPNAGGNSDDVGKISKPFGMDFSGIGLNNGITITPDPGKTGFGGVTAGTAEGVTVAPQSAGTPNNPNVPVRENILHSYVNWTSKIGFYMLGMEDYNGVMTSGNVAATAKRNPIAVSGGYQRGQAGVVGLQGDVYIDSLRFTSIIGNKSNGAATNNFDLEMQLFEPYGSALIGELLTMGQEVNPKMTLAEIPYMIEIDFTGYKDDGTPIPSILEKEKGKKYIPVRIVAMDMKLEAAGARYTLSLVPYSFYAFTERYAVIPKDRTVSGATVNDILGEGQTGLIGQMNAIENEKVTKDKSQDKPDVYKIKFYSFDKSNTKTDELQNAKVAYPTAGGDLTTLKNRPFTANDPQKQTYGVKANTIIKEAIRDLVLASEYFAGKMNSQSTQPNNKPAELLKVIPTIEIQKENWDGKRNEYAKTITFHVFNTLMFGENFQNGGTAPIQDWGYTKVYNYIFTGKNVDVIDCDINFNLIYYNKSTPDKKETSLILTDMVSPTESVRGAMDPNMIANPSTKTTSIMKTAPAENYRYVNATLAAEFFDLKMNNTKADMIQLDLTIIGDPDWIPQDASIRGGTINVTTDNSRLDKNGSIAVDVAGVYTKLQFKTPRDYDDAKGIMDVASSTNIIGGVYRVITVENRFEGGKFTCILNMVKIPNQEDNKITPQQMQNFNRDRQASAAEVQSLIQQSNTRPASANNNNTGNPAVTVSPPSADTGTSIPQVDIMGNATGF